MRLLELLAPAKNLECGMAAIDHGADAVYIGAQRFGARAAAGNSVDDISRLCTYAHQFGARVYITVNTIIYDHELEDTRLLLLQLQKAGADAVLVQDMALVGMVPDMPLHASTQTDNRTADKVQWLKSLGFSRVVLARELSVEEIADIHAQVPDVELEVFVHGALCVAYSGLCYASQHCFGRSANRGECAQFCRMKFDLLDADDHVIEHQRHLLSLKDLCLIDHLEELALAGATSFKIEGRLKDVSYVKNVTAAYSEQLNRIVAKHPDQYKRASKGRVNYTFTPNLAKTFNRGYTTYFVHGRQPLIASFDTPKAMGEYVGTVKEFRGSSFNVAGTASFANGDGLCFINADKELEGFRVNRVEGNRIFPLKTPANLRSGMRLYRNYDQEMERILSRPSAVRKIPIKMSLRSTSQGFILKAEGVEAELQIEHQQAQKPQHENIIRQLSKLGDTPFVCESIDIPSDFNYFIPNSQLTELRQQIVQQFYLYGLPLVSISNTDSKRYRYHLFPYWESYFYNIANHAARQFYEQQGLTTVADALEISEPPHAVLMQCRHCLRYALGYCVKNGGRHAEWKEPLRLRLGDGREFPIAFDCQHCQMNIYAPHA